MKMLTAVALGAALLAGTVAACRAPVITTDPGLKVGGTIAGIVRATGRLGVRL